MVDNGTTVTVTPTSGYTGALEVLYDVTDNKPGGTVTATATATMTLPPNNAPTVSGAATATNGYGNHQITFTKAQLLANATDIDGDTLTVGTVTTPSGTVVDNGNGTYTLTPTTNTSGVVTLSYTVSDGHGGTVADTATLTLAANPINVGLSGGSGTAGTGATITGSVSAGDNAGDTFTYTLVGANGGAAHGTVSINSTTGAYSYVQSDSTPSTDTFQVTSTNPDGYSTTTTVTVIESQLAQSDSTLQATTTNAIVDSDFAGFSSADTVALYTGAGTQSVTLGTVSDALGIIHVNAYLTTGAVLMDGHASSLNITATAGSGIDTFIAGSGINHAIVDGVDWTVTGGANSELFSLSTADLPSATLAGNSSFANMLVFNNAGTVNDSAFTNVSYVNMIGAHNGNIINLGSLSDAAGITIVDASHTTGAVTLDVSGTSGFMAFKAGTGVDTFIGSSNAGSNNAMYVESTYMAQDYFTGGNGYNNIVFTDTGAGTISDAAFTHVVNVANAQFAISGTLILGSYSQTAGLNNVNAFGAGGVIDASARTDAVTLSGWTDSQTFIGGSGNDIIYGDAGTDTLFGGIGADTLTGGADSDTFVYTASAQSNDPGGTRDTITDFATGTDHIKISLSGTHVDVSGFEVAGGYNLGQASLTGGSARTGGVIGDGFYATGSDHALYIYVGSTDSNISTDGGYVISSTSTINAADLQFVITGTAGNDTLVGGVGADTFTGGTGTDSLTGGTGADLFMATRLSSTATITDFDTVNDAIGLSNAQFSFGSSGTLAATSYAESTTAISGTAADYGGGNTGGGIIAIQNGSNVEVWHTDALEAATTANSHQVATLNSVSTAALDNTQFHLAV